MGAILEVLYAVNDLRNSTSNGNHTPVSSLDDTHLIELAVNIAELIKSSKSENLRFIITTHNPLFYNIFFNELHNSGQSEQ